VDFKAGDKVCIKGLDGPALTVADVRQNDVVCHWFDAGGGYHRFTFPAGELEPAPAPVAEKQPAHGHAHAPAHHAPAHHAPAHHGPKVTKGHE
jgi:uncharacterized protein YodC (DUF2158 family)